MKKPLLPVVDISSTDAGAVAKQVEDVREACLATGFFYGGQIMELHLGVHMSRDAECCVLSLNAAAGNACDYL